MHLLAIAQGCSADRGVRRIVAAACLILTTLATSRHVATAPAAAIPEPGRYRQAANCVREGCEIVLTRVVTPAARESAPLHGSAPPTVVQDQAGRFLVPTADRRTVAVFEASGRLIALLNIVAGTDRAVLLFANPRNLVLAWQFPSGRALAIHANLKAMAGGNPLSPGVCARR